MKEWVGSLLIEGKYKTIIRRCYQLPSCKDIYYDKWCKDEKPVYTDEAGMEYCVFHAPKGKIYMAKKYAESSS